MLPDRVSNPGPLIYESGALSIALRGPAPRGGYQIIHSFFQELIVTENGANETGRVASPRNVPFSLIQMHAAGWPGFAQFKI